MLPGKSVFHISLPLFRSITDTTWDAIREKSTEDKLNVIYVWLLVFVCMVWFSVFIVLDLIVLVDPIFVFGKNPLPILLIGNPVIPIDNKSCNAAKYVISRYTDDVCGDTFP